MMDISEVKACLRALLSSSALSYTLRTLLHEFRNMTGFDLPLFGFKNPVEFLRTLTDTVQLIGDYHNPIVALVKSAKSSHITSLVDRQRNKKLDNGQNYGRCLPRRLILPSYVQEPANNFSFRSKCMESNYPTPVWRVFPQNMDNQQRVPNALSYDNQNSFRKFEDQRRNQMVFSTPVQNNCEPPPLFTTPKRYPQQNHLQQNLVNPPHVEAKCQKIGERLPNQLPRFLESLRTYSQRENATEPPMASQGNSQETEKADSCYFEDFSDNESFENFKTSSGERNSPPHTYINDGMKKKLQSLIKKHPEGLWCCELPNVFVKEFNVALDYREFGFTSLIQMLSELQDVFRCIRPGNEDWILFDASVPPSEREKKMMKLQENGNVANDVANSVHKLLLKHSEIKPDLGVELTEIPRLYEMMFGTPLDFQTLGFPTLKSFLETYEGTLFKIYEVDKKYQVRAVLKTVTHSSHPWKEALPPITKDNDIFKEIFPNDVVGPEGKYPKLDLSLHIAVGQRIEVCVAEVWSPGEFCLQLNKFKHSRDRFAADLQKFYNTHVNKYKMPDSTIVPHQLCVGLYSDDPENPDEWNRAQILKVVNERTVIVEFVDFGTVARIRKTQLRFLHRNFHSFPVQAFFAELYKVAPKGGDSWSMRASKKFLELSQVPFLEAELMDIDFKKPLLKVVLHDPSQKPCLNVNKQLVVENLAEFVEVQDDAFLFEVEEPENTETANGFADVPGEFSESSDLECEGHTMWFNLKKSRKSADTPQVDEKPTEDMKPKTEEIVSEFEEVPEWDKIEEKPETKTSLEKERVEKSELFEVKEEIPPKRITPKKKEGDVTKPEAAGKRLPPGFKRMIDLNRFRVMNIEQPDEIKKKINILAIELLTTNPSIKQVAVQDPSLALKIATEMAEVYIRSVCYDINPYGTNPFLGGMLSDPSFLLPFTLPFTDVGVFPLVPPPPQPPPPPVVCDIQPKKEVKPPNVSPVKPDTPPHKASEKKYLQVLTVGEKTTHIVKMNGQVYFFAEELIRTFSSFTNRDVADRVLHLKKIVIEYKILNKTNGEKILSEVKSSDIPGVFKKKSKKWNVYLIPVGSVIAFLQGLGCETKLFLNEITKLGNSPVKQSTVSSPS